MKTLFLLLATLLIVSGSLSAQVFYAPYDTSKISYIRPEIAIENDEGAYLIVGNVSQKQEGTDYKPSGIFLMNLVPDNMFIYDYHDGFYTEFFLEGKPITAGKDYTEVFYRENGNIVVITSWNQIYTPGGSGFAGYMTPYVMEFDSSGELVYQYADTNNKRDQNFGQFTPIIVNEDESFYMFNKYANDTTVYLYASKYDKKGDLTERIPVVEALKDTIGDHENVEILWYEPVQAIKKNNNTYLVSKKIRYNDNKRKYSAVLMKLDPQFNIVAEREFITYEYDHENKKVRTTIYDMIFNSKGELLVFGRHGFSFYEYKQGAKDHFAYFLDPEDLSVNSKHEWMDSVNKAKVIREVENNKYIASGQEYVHYDSPYYSTENTYNYSAFLFNENFELVGKQANTNKKQDNDAFTIPLNPLPHTYDFFGYFDNRAILVRLQEKDFDPVSVKEHFNEDAENYFGYSNNRIFIGSTLIGNSEVQVYNILGELQFSRTFNKNEELQTIENVNLNEGVYLLKAYINGKVITGKILVN